MNTVRIKGYMNEGGGGSGAGDGYHEQLISSSSLSWTHLYHYACHEKKVGGVGQHIKVNPKFDKGWSDPCIGI